MSSEASTLTSFFGCVLVLGVAWGGTPTTGTHPYPEKYTSSQVAPLRGCTSNVPFGPGSPR